MIDTIDRAVASRAFRDIRRVAFAVLVAIAARKMLRLATGHRPTGVDRP